MPNLDLYGLKLKILKAQTAEEVKRIVGFNTSSFDIGRSLVITDKIGEMDFMAGGEDIKEYVKERMRRKLTQELHQQGYIQYTEEKSYFDRSTIISAKIKVMK